MAKFDHPNVMGLIGVSLSNKTPFLVMPYMANGCLLSYLRKKRAELTIENESSTELVIGINIGSKNVCEYFIMSNRYKRVGRGYSQCAYRLQKAWSIWPPTSLFIETLLPGIACMSMSNLL